jgi:hypothetical protein
VVQPEHRIVRRDGWDRHWTSDERRRGARRPVVVSPDPAMRPVMQEPLEKLSEARGGPAVDERVQLRIGGC